MFKKVVFLVLISLMFFLVSCEDKSTKPDVSDDQTIVAEETVVISPDDAEVITDVSENQIVFDGEVDEEIYQVDNIIVSEPTDLAPYGLLRKVVSHSSQGGQVVVNTVPARLEDALDQFEINITQNLKTSDIETTHALVEGITFKEDTKNPYTFPYEIDFDADLGNDISLEVNGDLSLTLGYEFLTKKNWGEGLHYVKAGAFITYNGDFELVVDGSFNYEDSIELIEHDFWPVTFLFAGFPIVLVPKVIVVLEIDASGEASITSYLSSTASYSAGLIYDKPDWTNYKEKEINYDYTPPGLSTNMDANVSAGPRFEINLYGISGPFAYGRASMNLTADVNENPWWTLSGGYSVDVGIKFDALGYVLDRTFEDVISHSTILAQAAQNQVASISFTPPGGTYNEAQNVTLACNTPGATIRYTTNGSSPTVTSQVYSNPINISGTTTIKAKGYKDGWDSSEVASSIYTISQTEIVANPTFDPAPGIYSEPQSVEINCVTSNAEIYYTLDGSLPTESSQIYNSPITISSSKTIKARAFKTNYQSSEIVVGDYTINVDPVGMIFIQGGTFNNGTSDVTISSFYICKYEVTQAEYQAVMGTNPSDFIGSNRPVEDVSWNDAVQYCNTRSIQEGLTLCYDTSDWTCDFTANGYRLPTEMEWMYAAKGGNQQPATGYNQYSGTNLEAQLTNYAWYQDNQSNGTKQVGTKLPNQLGIYDMSGNVREWCNDWYGSYSSDSQTDPVGPSSGLDRVLRGGSYEDIAAFCRVFSRAGYTQAFDWSFLGFRVARSSEFTVSSPVFTPPADVYNSPQDVIISCATTDAQIYFTLDGSEPTESSQLFTTAINIYENTTIRAKCYKANFQSSNDAVANYVIETLTVSIPTFNPVGGTYNTAQNVTISCSTPGATIRYTTNGSNPIATSLVYSSPINVSSTTTLKAKGYKDGWDSSEIASSIYTISQTETVANPTFNPAPGVYSESQSVEINCVTSNAEIYYTLDGSVPTESSQIYNSPITISSSKTIKARAFKTNYQSSEIVIGDYTINGDIEPTPMVFITGGTFTMGRTTGYGYPNELPTHQVTLSSFYIGKYEVTQAEYESIIGSNPSYFSGEDKPVEEVSWYDAVEYCNARSIQEDLEPCYDTDDWLCDFSANGYRLPTEAEWEYAVRGASNNPDYLYAGSDNIEEVAWYSSNSSSTTHNVGTKSPNQLGIYDMSGNVCEWCNDWYGNYSSGAQTDPVGPETGSGRVTRGGGRGSADSYCRVATRSSYYPWISYGYIGFRLARSSN